jgi:transposase InsO family protein
MMCRVHGVSRGGFYAWAGRGPSARARADHILVEQIERVHAHSRGNYGSPRVQAQLCQDGFVVGRPRVARLMQLRGLHGRSARNTRSLGHKRDAALTTQALEHAMRKRNAQPGLVFHTDRGMEYAALDFKRQLARKGFIQSMNRPGKMNDNAHMESFFHTMKTEGLHGMSFDTDNALHRELRSYIRFYNQQRLHSSLNYLAPVAFERQLAYQSSVN